MCGASELVGFINSLGADPGWGSVIQLVYVLGLSGHSSDR